MKQDLIRLECNWGTGSIWTPCNMLVIQASKSIKSCPNSFISNGGCFCVWSSVFFARCTSCIFCGFSAQMIVIYFIFRGVHRNVCSKWTTANGALFLAGAPCKSWFKFEEDWHCKPLKLLRSHILLQLDIAKKTRLNNDPLQTAVLLLGTPSPSDTRLKECQRLFQRIGAMNDENAVLKVRVWKPGSSIEGIFLWDEATWNDLEWLRWCLFHDP